MSVYELFVPQYKKMLLNLDRWIDKGVAFCEEKKVDPRVLLDSRLAPDQFSLTQQVQSACDQAKYAAARLSGREPPRHPDTERTLEEVKRRIQTVLAYLD